MARLKSSDRDAMDRLHERGLISDPKAKVESVALPGEGVALTRQMFQVLSATTTDR